ncbi:MAG: hypothetical protein JO270_20545 [Acidobacteriaceae bacterium]|nr:hypothetical protein [Acidobacteriaceae bacterium]
MTCLAATLHSEIIDRLLITVGQHRVITELQLDEELRVTAFLNGTPVVRDAETRRQAADRLVEQLLIRREMDLSRYPLPDAKEVSSYLEQMQSRFGTPEEFRERMGAYDLTEEVLREHLAFQLTTVRFIEYRFSSDLSVSDDDIRNYYQNEAARDKQAGKNPPAFAAVEESIRQKLVEQRTDQALDNWLEETRKQVNIVYLDKTLQ